MVSRISEPSTVVHCLGSMPNTTAQRWAMKLCTSKAGLFCSMELIEHWGFLGRLLYVDTIIIHYCAYMYINIYKIDLFRNFAEGKFWLPKCMHLVILIGMHKSCSGWDIHTTQKHTPIYIFDGSSIRQKSTNPWFFEWFIPQNIP